MAEITASLVKTLRDKTNVGMMECKVALKESGGDIDAAVDILRKKGVAVAAKKQGRSAKDGLIQSYIHAGGKIGVMVEVNCETDFVAKNEGFEALCKDIAMHIAAANPLYVQREEVPQQELEKEKAIYKEQIKGKPENIIDKIVEGKVGKYYAEVCLLEQQFVKDPELSIKDLLTQKIAEIGENIQIKRFVRFQLGEE